MQEIILLRLNKKLWSFNIGCIISGAFIALIDISQSLSIPNVVLSNVWFNLEVYYALVIFFSSVFVTGTLIFIMHFILNVHSNEHTFWLVFPILTFLIITAVFAKVLIFSMLNAAIPALILILAVARKKKERRIFDMKKALS